MKKYFVVLVIGIIMVTTSVCNAQGYTQNSNQPMTLVDEGRISNTYDGVIVWFEWGGQCYLKGLHAREMKDVLRKQKSKSRDFLLVFSNKLKARECLNQINTQEFMWRVVTDIRAFKPNSQKKIAESIKKAGKMLETQNVYLILVQTFTNVI